MKPIFFTASLALAFLTDTPLSAQHSGDLHPKHDSPPDAAHTLEETVVTAAPLPPARDPFSEPQPASFIDGQRLTLALQPTLGETLSGTPGVSSTYFGPVASRPILRGLDGDRIRVLQNGSNTLDASATSVDHAVSFDPVAVRGIEIIRGPAVLRYGPNAIGGVVNVLDGRIPEERIDRPIRGTLDGKYASANGERGGAFSLEGGLANFAWHLEGYKRATNDLQIPGFARSARLRKIAPLADGEPEPKGVLPNSDLRTEGLSGGVSYIWDSGFFGLAYSGFHTNYGTVAERDVTIDMEQRRWDFRGAFFEPFRGVKSIRYNLGISDYEHTEFEGAAVGTRFENEGYDGRIEAALQPLGIFEGVVGLQWEHSNFSALGEEAFLPPVETRMQSAFVFEEAKLSPHWRAQFGARLDHVSVASSRAAGFGPGQERTFSNVSASAGVSFEPNDTYAVALNATFAQRPPTYQELFAHGPHVATNTFEIGDPALQPERALSLELSLRKKQGRVTGSLTGFYYRYHDFIGQFPTGATVAGEEDDLPVYAYRATDAQFFGGEAEFTFHLLAPPTIDAPKKPAPPPPASVRTLDLVLKSDYVHASDPRVHQPLPRIPPWRASAALEFQRDRLSARVEGQFSARQNRTAEFELPTDSYFLLNASAGYHLPLGRAEMEYYVKGVNLTNAEARLHTSFLKDIAPLGGRGVVVGVKVAF